MANEPLWGLQCRICGALFFSVFRRQVTCSLSCRKENQRRLYLAWKHGVRTQSSESSKAKASGHTRYFTGNPCIRGHVCERYARDNSCVQCDKDDRRSRPSVVRTNRKYRAKRDERGRIAVQALAELGVDLGYRASPAKEPIGASSRREALLSGARRYFTGKPCKHGHISSRKISGGCDECTRLHRRSSKRGGKKSKTESKKRSRQRQRAALTALNELGIQI